MRFKPEGLILIFLGVLLGSGSRVYSQEDWKVFSSEYCTIFYEQDVSLKKINRRINLRYSDFYNYRKYRQNLDISSEEILAAKFDAIFRRVEEILDMYPSRIHVTVNIYKSTDNLNSAYEEIFDRPNTAPSFYIYRTNTIYTTERAITENILAHEMAHCIIDHYFVILPPKKIQEMLAIYADVHLKD